MASTNGRVWGVLGTLVAGVALAGCGDSAKSGASCGEGTVEVNGTCVVADTGTPADSTADTTEQDVADSTTGDSMMESATDANLDTQTSEADAASASDPCPALTAKYNCSDTCGGPVGCDAVKCGANPLLRILDYPELPMVFRTPDHPGTDPNCAKNCASLGSAKTPLYGIGFRVVMPYISSGVRVRVDPPWSVHTFDVYRGFCEQDSYGQCIANADRQSVLISTHDPNAPARNVYVERVDPDAGPACP